MNTKITTALSVVGVLSAGTAAAAVNTTILDRPSADTSVVESPAVSTTPSTIAATTTVQAATTLDIEVVTITTPPPTTTAAPQYLTTFNVGEAGSVTVDVVADELQIVEINVADGWDGAETGTGNPVAVEANFASGTLRVRFVATFADGVITPNVTSSSTEPGPIIVDPAPQSGSNGSGSAQTPPPDPQQQDDDYEDDDYEDEDDYEEDDYEDDDYEEDEDEDDEGDEDDEHEEDEEDEHEEDEEDEHEEDERDD